MKAGCCVFFLLLGEVEGLSSTHIKTPIQPAKKRPVISKNMEGSAGDSFLGINIPAGFSVLGRIADCCHGGIPMQKTSQKRKGTLTG